MSAFYQTFSLMVLSISKKKEESAPCSSLPVAETAAPYTTLQAIRWLVERFMEEGPLEDTLEGDTHPDREHPRGM